MVIEDHQCTFALESSYELCYPSEVLGENPFGIATFASRDAGISVLADMSAIPEEMYDSYILRALEYTGNERFRYETE